MDHRQLTPRPPIRRQPTRRHIPITGMVTTHIGDLRLDFTLALGLTTVAAIIGTVAVMGMEAITAKLPASSNKWAVELKKLDRHFS